MAFVLSFGKHKGKTLEWLFFNDPGYVWWILQNNVEKDSTKFTSAERSRFETLVRRARHLRIPGTCSWCNKKPIRRMFLTQHVSGGLARVDFDCEDCFPAGSSTTSALQPSFFTPDYYRSYDKFGAHEMIRAIKYAFYKDTSVRMTQKRLEEFFNNPDHFVDF